MKKLKQRLIITVSCLCVLLSLLPGTALAADRDAEREDRLYQLLLEGIRSKTGLDGKSYIDISELSISNEEGSPDRDLLWTVFDRVFYDHPEFYYLREGYVRVHKNTPYVVGVRPMYASVAQDAGAQARFDAAVDKALAQAEGLTDPVEQMLALYNYLIRTTAYNYEVAADQADSAPREAWTAYGALVSGDTVCKGYTMAWKVLMDRLGIPCLVVCKGDRNHLWNMVQLDGKWYHIDVNKGNNLVPVLRGRCVYTDFLVTDKAMSKHVSWFVPGTQYRDAEHWDTSPACTDTKFETGWIFRRDNIFHPMYRDEAGQYYYIRFVDLKTAKLYRGPLFGDAEEVSVLKPYAVPWGKGSRICGGAVWAEGCLYYVSADLELMRFRPSDGESVSLGGIPFTPKAAEDGRYGAEYDGIGLLYDDASGVLSARSICGREELKTWQITAPPVVFEDVAEEDYFARPVKWAVEKGITNGTSKTAFSPARTCSRAEIITFLWRAAGSPEPKGGLTVSDVYPGDYYYKAVLWAAEGGMFSGDVFSPGSPCTRAEAVEFMWEQAGRPESGGVGFADVPPDAGYAQAVAWALENGVTLGTGETTFSPEGTCTRGQIVTFLHRAFAE